MKYILVSCLIKQLKFQHDVPVAVLIGNQPHIYSGENFATLDEEMHESIQLFYRIDKSHMAALILL